MSADSGRWWAGTEWGAGGKAAYEEMSCLVNAGATPEELEQIARQTEAGQDPAASCEEQERVSGYLAMTAHMAEQLLYQRDAEMEAEAG